MSWRDLRCGELAARARRASGSRSPAGSRAAATTAGSSSSTCATRPASCQLVINPERAPEAAKAAHEIRNEFVLRATGEVVARAPETVNPNMPTGEVELQVDELEIVSRSTPLPFQLDEENVDETLRLRYRWLDLRRDKLQRNIRLRAQMVAIIRRDDGGGRLPRHRDADPVQADARGRARLPRPERGCSTGRFFALPQSPQILKQLLVIAGFDRYYQIAHLLPGRGSPRRPRPGDHAARRRDGVPGPGAHLRADGADVRARSGASASASSSRRPFPRMTYAEADAPLRHRTSPTCASASRSRTRPRSRAARSSASSRSAEAVRFLRVPQEFSRAELATLEELAKEWGAKGLAYLVFDEDGEVRSPIAKFLSEAELDGVPRATRATTRPLRRRRRRTMVARVLGALRLHLGRELGLIDERRVRVPLGHRLPDVRVGRGRRALDGACTIRSRGRRRSRRRCSTTTRARARATPTTSS